jgi:hypothetical protein
MQLIAAKFQFYPEIKSIEKAVPRPQIGQMTQEKGQKTA